MKVIARSKMMAFLPVTAFALAMLLVSPGCEQNNGDADADSNGASSNNGTETRQVSVRTDVPSREQELLADAAFDAILDDDEAGAIELVKRGADVHATDHRDISLLHYAARATMPELTRILLENGADVNVGFGNNQQPIHWAGRAGASDRSGAEETIDVLLEFGADINARTEGGTTPISYSVRLNNRRWQEFLISRGATLD